MEKIGLFGGSFNPVHLEHINIAKNAIKELNLDRLIIMPTFIPPHKDTVLASPEDRLNMLKLAFNNIDKVEVSDYEINKKGTSFTYLTVEYLKEKYDCELYFIMGEDLIATFDSWKSPDKIVEKAQIVSLSRDNYTIDFDKVQKDFFNKYGKSFIKLTYNGKNYSSTRIRVFSALGLPIDNLTDKKVAKYIQDNGLYKEEKHLGYIEYIKKALPTKRLMHTASVIDTALRRASENGLDKDKVFLAGLLHDMAKYVDYTKVSGFTVPEDMPDKVIHAFLGAYLLENNIKFDDLEIIEAVRYHTTGKPNMSKLTKLIFIADMVEDFRVYEGVDYLRECYEKYDLDSCLVECLKEEIIHLKRKNLPIYRLTLEAYEYYKNLGE